MKHACALLADEVSSWPGVNTRPMFGFRAVYREGVVFAMLPDKRSLEIADSVAYKDGGKWKSFEVRDERGIGGALGVLEEAYMACGKI
jgi:hypothetical protein